MATKHDNHCLQNAADDEPIFVLRAQDMLASETVRHWARRAHFHGVSPEKTDEAWEIAAAMDLWPNRKLPD